jgi:RNA polymerase sigma-32 factor
MVTSLQTADVIRYQKEIGRFPLLRPEEEAVLAKSWRERADREAVHKLLTSHLRLVVKVARSFRGYGLPFSELISEGNVGLIQAADRFDPGKGFRFSTYAVWWIKAAIQQYILRSWSLVKIGTKRSERTLFFNLRKLKNRIAALQDGDMHPEQVKFIAKHLEVDAQDVVEMNRRMGGDISLNLPISNEQHTGEYQDWLVDERPNQEQQLAENDEFELRREALRQALSTLSDRERYVLEMRRLAHEPLTLEVLAATFRVSSERVRQIETQAFEKVCKAVRRLAACEIVTTGSSAVSPRTRNPAVLRQDNERFSRQFTGARGCKRVAGRRSSQVAASGSVRSFAKMAYGLDVQSNAIAVASKHFPEDVRRPA